MLKIVFHLVTQDQSWKAIKVGPLYSIDWFVDVEANPLHLFSDWLINTGLICMKKRTILFARNTSQSFNLAMIFSAC